MHISGFRLFNLINFRRLRKLILVLYRIEISVAFSFVTCRVYKLHVKLVLGSLRVTLSSFLSVRDEGVGGSGNGITTVVNSN